jgi:Tfp pilus assembly protein FimT
MFMRKINNGGITLIELVVVFVIIAVLALLMAPNIGRWMPRYRLRSATRDIISTLRTAQMRAVSNDLTYQVVFNPAGPGLGTYTLQRNSGGLITTEGVAQTAPPGVTFVTNFPANTAVFNPNSTATGGTVTVSIPTGSRTITVLSSTARITAP